MSAATTPRKLPSTSIPLAALMQLAMRLGFAKRIARAFRGRIRSATAQRSAFAGYRPTRH